MDTLMQILSMIIVLVSIGMLICFRYLKHENEWMSFWIIIVPFILSVIILPFIIL